MYSVFFVIRYLIIRIMFALYAFFFDVITGDYGEIKLKGKVMSIASLHGTLLD